MLLQAYQEGLNVLWVKVHTHQTLPEDSACFNSVEYPLSGNSPQRLQKELILQSYFFRFYKKSYPVHVLIFQIILYISLSYFFSFSILLKNFCCVFLFHSPIVCLNWQVSTRLGLLLH